ncbi:MAG: FecCD family ABC transporter permease [Capsulimonadaceae bacterium]
MTTAPRDSRTPRQNDPARSDRPARAGLALTTTLVLLASSLVVTAGIGSVHYSPAQVLAALRHGPAGDDPVVATVWEIRMPEILLAALVGAALASAGVAFQCLLRNDLADPYIVGVSSGASVGAEAVLLVHGEAWLGGAAVSAAAFATALGAMVVVYGIARHGARIVVSNLLLSGVIVTSFLTSVSTLLLQFGNPGDSFHIISRLMGSLQEATLPQCRMLAVVLTAGCLALLTQARTMNIFALGEEQAAQLGVDVERFKAVLVVVASLLTAAAVSVAGIIGFVGLVVPHIARRAAGTPDHRRVIPLAAAAGALLLLWADAISRSIMPDGRVLPVGIITAFIGAPFFIILLRRKLTAAHG